MLVWVPRIHVEVWLQYGCCHIDSWHPVLLLYGRFVITLSAGNKKKLCIFQYINQAKVGLCVRVRVCIYVCDLHVFTSHT